VIPAYTVASILETSRIEEVVGDFVNLKRRGSNLIGLCPFHQEKTPSFTVSPSKGIFKCFGCGKAGDSARFIMEHEHYSYPEALRYLAAKYQIEVEEREQSPEEVQEQNERERLFNLNSFARDYFNNTLFETQEGRSIGLAYFKERDFREPVVRKFQLGYCPDQKDAFSAHARKQGYSAEALMKTGLSVGSEERLYDRFQGRVIFPIHNLTGKVIGFGGRIMVSDKSKAKYLNSPESEVYNKSKSLYGLYYAKTAISRLDHCLLVEGYTDVISLHQAGIEHVVSSSGTSLTTEQVRLIRRYTNNITILYDGDKAGVNASLRGIDMILEEGMNVRVLLFPEGDDPDSFVRKHRTSEVEEFIMRESKDFISFKTGLLLEEAAGDPIRKAGLIREIVTTISLIPDPIYRSVYVKECSRMLDVAEATLMNELNKLLRNKFRKQLSPDLPELPAVQAETQIQGAEPEQEVPTFHQERELIRLLLMYGNHELMIDTVDEDGFPAVYRDPLARYILDDLRNDAMSFSHPTHLKIMEMYLESLDEGVVPHEQHFVSNPEPDIALLCIDLITERYQLSQNWEKHKIFVKSGVDNLRMMADSALIHFKRKAIDSTMTALFQQLKESQEAEEQIIIQAKIRELKKIDMSLSQKPGIIISK
jgi:DNA primase